MDDHVHVKHGLSGNDQLAKHEALAALRAMPNWVVWRLETVKGKPTKVPYQARQPKYKASSKNPTTWADFETAINVRDVNGTGFCLFETEISAFDLDDCRDSTTGIITPWAQKIVDRCASYTEITTSGTGLRIIGTGQGPKVSRKQQIENGSVETYRKATRYIAMTGDVFKDAPLANLDQVIDEVVKELDALKKKKGNGADPQERPQRRGRKRTLPQQLANMLYLQGDQPADYPSRSELFYAFICAALGGVGIDDDYIVDLCLDRTYAGCSIFEHVADNGGESYVKKQIERKLNEPAQAKTQKKLVRLTEGHLDEHYRTVARALRAAECPVYQRGDVLVVPLWKFQKTGHNEQEILSCRIVKYSWHQLADMAQHHAVIFQQYSVQKKGWRVVDPPKNLILRLLSAGHWGFAELAGIITAPSMRHDGSIISTPGYDERTGLWYKAADGVELPDIPEYPTKEQAKEALAPLKELVAECAFADLGVDRSVALAAMMTVVLRGAFEVAPLFFISKPEAGTGGSYLVKIISTLALGREAIPLKVSDDPKELEKELSAAAYEAQPIINLNNLTIDLKSPLLAQMVTERVIRIRPFGKNTETIECDCRATTIIANGNNVEVAGDLVRRTVRCRLDAKMARPELKVFAGDPISKIKGNRGKYLACVFTIVLAYMNAQEKVEVDNINGFEGWSKFVREPLIWLGETDPMKSQEDARARDPDRAALKARFDALAKHIGVNTDFDAAKVLAKGSELGPNHKPANPALCEAFECLKGSTKSIGWLLSKDLNRQTADHRLELAGTGRSNTYRLCAVTPQAAAGQPQAGSAHAGAQPPDDEIPL